MKRNSILIALLMPSLMFACNHVYKEYDKKSFSTLSWKDGQEIVFNPEIKDISKNYRLTVGLRHHYAIQLRNFSANLKIVSPSGKVISNDIDFKIKNQENKNTGKCAGDLCDLDVVVSDNFKFSETGQYKVVITHNQPGYKIPGVLELGLIIDEAD